MRAKFSVGRMLSGHHILTISSISIVALSTIIAGIWLEKARLDRSYSYINAIVSTCGGKTSANCLDQTVLQGIQSGGLQYGFTIIYEWYVHDPSFRPTCNEFAMRIGAELYRSVPDYKTLAFTRESTFCNYGLFQEYPHVLLLDTRHQKSSAVLRIYRDAFKCRGAGCGGGMFQRHRTRTSLQQSQLKERRDCYGRVCRKNL